MQLPLGVLSPVQAGLPGLPNLGSAIPRRNFTLPTARLNRAGQTSITVAFPAGATSQWTAPDNVFWVDGIAQAGVGTDAYSYYIQQYRTDVTTYNTYSNGQTFSTPNGTSYSNGATPTDYCNTPTTLNGTTTYNCYHFTDTSYYNNSPATQGGSTTAFDFVFAGDYGSSLAPLVGFNGAIIQPGQTYSITIPYGGSLTITFYQ